MGLSTITITGRNGQYELQPIISFFCIFINKCNFLPSSCNIASAILLYRWRKKGKNNFWSYTNRYTIHFAGIAGPFPAIPQMLKIWCRTPF
jgi:hypothetical protein